MGDLVGPRPAADVEEVRRLAAGPLHQVHRRHRQAGAVDHAADRAVELDERQPGLARGAVGRVLLVGVAEVLEPRVAGEGRVVEGDLRVEADERSTVGAVRPGLAHDRERVDLDEVGVVRVHRPDEARRDRHRVLEVGGRARGERHLAGLRTPGVPGTGRQGS